MSALRVALFGAGMVSEHHLRAWSTVPDARVVAIVDPDRAKAEARARSFGIARVFEDVAALFDATELDAVDIATPVVTHAALCRAAAGRGLAILCQKPLCPSVAEAEDLARTIAAPARLMVHENWRFRPEYRAIGEIFARAAPGEIRAVRMRALSSGLIADRAGAYPALIRQPFLARMPRLIVFELLVHHLDVLNWLFGPLSVESVRLERRCPVVAGEDTADIRLRGASGFEVSLFGSFAEPGAPAHVDDELTVERAGDGLRFANRRLSVGDETREFPFEESYARSYAGAIGAFAAAVKSGADFEMSPARHLEVLRLVERIYASAPALGR